MSGRDGKHGIEWEPHLRGEAGPPDPSERRAERTLGRSAARADAGAETARHSVFDEPAGTVAPAIVGADDASGPCGFCGYSREGLGPGERCPECGRAQVRDYRSWVQGKAADTPWPVSWLTIVIVAALGGPWAVLGAMLAETYDALATVVAGPLSEEVMKVAAVVMVIETRPYLLRGRAQIWIATLASALVFAAIENWLYLNVYVPASSPALVWWRWTVCVALHAGCTAIATIGVQRMWIESRTSGRWAQVGAALPWVVAAAVVHGAYNGAMLVLGALGMGV